MNKEAAELPDIVRRYAEAHDVTRQTIEWHKCIVRRYTRFCGGTLTPDDFCPERVNAWLTNELSVAERSRVTIKSYRRCLLILWRWGYEGGLLHHPPLKVKQIKAPLPVPTGFTADEVARLVEEAAKLRSVFNSGIFRAAYYVALIRTAWDTGFRQCDLMRLRMSDFNEQGRGAIVQLKTGTTAFFTLRQSTVEAIKATYPHARPFLFGGVVSRTKMYRALRWIAKDAGLKGPVLRKIRRGAASAVERMQPGHAGRFLGHRTPGIAERHYLDPRIVNTQRPRPPALDGNADMPDDAATTMELPAAIPTHIQAAVPARRPNEAILMLLSDFLLSPGIVSLSVSRQSDLLAAIRQGIEDCKFLTPDELSGERLAAWIRGRQQAGLSARRVVFLREAWLRFLGWMLGRAPGAKVAECLGRLYAAGRDGVA